MLFLALNAQINSGELLCGWRNFTGDGCGPIRVRGDERLFFPFDEDVHPSELIGAWPLRMRICLFSHRRFRSRDGTGLLLVIDAEHPLRNRVRIHH
jgi:hypothetical protein